MKILVTSDLHGNLPVITEPFDLLLLCGDICPAHDHYYAYQIDWIQHEFANWVKNLPYANPWSKVVMTWGNHDFVGERIDEAQLTCLKITTDHRLEVLRNKTYDFEYLCDEGIKTLKIFGTPYCKIFGNWAFMVNNDKLEVKFGEMPEDADIVISHDSPTTNGLGMIKEGYNKGTDAGNPVLAKYIEERKPKFFFSGHIHSGTHKFEKIGDTYMANVSFVNERYNPVNQVLVFNIDDNKELVDFSGIDAEVIEY